MATLYITEYEGATTINGVTVPHAPKVTGQTVTISGSTTTSSAFNKATHVVRLCSDTTCSYEIATAAVATTTSQRLPANVIEYVTVTPLDQVAVISNT